MKDNFRWGLLETHLVEEQNGAQLVGPNELEVYSIFHLSNDRLTLTFVATNILLQGLPKGIYTLINHYTYAKDIWDNVKMLLEGSDLTKEDRESQLYDDFEHFRQPRRNYSRLLCLVCQIINDIAEHQMNRSRMSLKLKRRGNNARVQGAAGYGVRSEQTLKQIQVKQDILSVTTTMENGVALDEEQLLFLAGGQENAVVKDVDEQPVHDLALNVDNVFQADDCEPFGLEVG
ncbi:hypothetical protein Tco_0290389 [Tanacetum coccineum]